MSILEGAMTALVTPFKNGKVDTETYAKLIKRQIENGIDAIVPVGTTGESATLTHSEHRECIEIAVAVVKDTEAKVIAGAGSNATHESVALAQFAQEAGADALLCVSPYYNKPTQEGLYQHYKTIAESVEIDVMPYCVPGRTGISIDVETMIRLFDDVKNINSIKEATGSLERVVALNSAREDINILSGEDLINYAIMSNGGAGCISVTSNLLPALVSEVIHEAQAQDYKRAKELSNSLYEINSLLFIESNPIPVKAAMYMAGLIPNLEYRLPLVPMADKNYQKLEKAVEKFF